MAACLNSSCHSDRDRQIRSKIWKPLIHEIGCLVEILEDVDNDETKSMDIIAEHTERIANAIPSNPIDIWYPKPIHRLLSVNPLERIEIPLDVLKLLVSSGFDINEDYGKYIYHDTESDASRADYDYDNDNDNDSDDSGDDTGEYRLEKMTCLHLAIMNQHWNAVRWLVQHGVDCDKECHEYFKGGYNYISPILMLARHQDAPLDLFGLLITPNNLNGGNRADPPLHAALPKGHIDIVNHLIKLGASVNQTDRMRNSPLYIATCIGHTDLALLLIEHGASVNQRGGFHDDLPIEGYIDKYRESAQNKLFLQLIPGNNMDILKAISRLLKMEIECSYEEKEHRMEVLSSMLHKLIQKLECFESLSMTIGIRDEYDEFVGWDTDMYFMELNGHLIAMNFWSLNAIYLCSVLLVLLGCTCDVSFRDFDIKQSYFADNAEHVYHATAILELWDTYNKNKCVKRLQALCIQKTRQSMRRLADESFESLPVPSSMRKLLMLHDVADVLFKAYQMWPKCMPIEELM